MRRFCRSRQLALVIVVMLAGCRASGSGTGRQGESLHLQALVTVYNFAASKLGHRPANETELQSFIAASAGPILESLHIHKAEELFVSERDGEPFVVLYGPAPTGAGQDVIAYEHTGVAGKRLVGYSIGAIAETDEQQFTELFSAASHTSK